MLYQTFLPKTASNFPLYRYLEDGIFIAAYTDEQGQVQICEVPSWEPWFDVTIYRDRAKSGSVDFANGGSIYDVDLYGEELRLQVMEHDGCFDILVRKCKSREMMRERIFDPKLSRAAYDGIDVDAGSLGL
jgi:hypothetical protein